MSQNKIYPLINNISKYKLLNINRLNYFVRFSSYQTSQFTENVKETPKFETTNNPDEWKYVERLLPSLIIPTPKEKQQYLSGWKPPTITSADSLKYFVQRNKNFMIPVYLETSHRGMKKTTKIRKIQGDVVQLEKDIGKYLEKAVGRPVATISNEFVGYVHVKGDHVNLVKDYLLEKGF